MTISNPDPDGSSKRGSIAADHHTYNTTPHANSGAILLYKMVPLAVVATIALLLETSFMSSGAAAAATVAIDAPDSAQEVSILTAHTTADPISARGGGDLIVSDGALVPGGVVGDDLVNDKTYESGEISLYVVREGDTLSQIAEMFSVNSNTILWANDIENVATIQPGDTLVILPITGVQHVIKSGDSLASIAKKYDGDVDEIMTYNRLAAAEDITVGDTVVVPGGNIATVAPTKRVGTPTKVTGSAAASASFMHPAPGTVKTQGIHGYNAVDLAGSVGTVVRAAAAGEVLISKNSGWNGGYGNYIVVRHTNGSQTLYAHLSGNVAGVGAYVGAGETIGYLGNTGRSTGAHLHFEVRGARNPF